MKKSLVRVQKTQPTRVGPVTAVWQTAVQIVSTPPAPDSPFLGKPAMPTRWMAGASSHKEGDVETNPGSTTTREQAWIYDVCHRRIHGRKQIS